MSQYQQQHVPQHVQPPPRSLNGGLFTGEPFMEGAPWANVPVIPDVDYMTNKNLRSANPPLQALFQYPGNTRPGNNYQANSGLKPYTGINGFDKLPYNFSCIPCQNFKPQQSPNCKCKYMSNISGNSCNTCTCDKTKFIDVTTYI